MCVCGCVCVRVCLYKCNWSSLESPLILLNSLTHTHTTEINDITWQLLTSPETGIQSCHRHRDAYTQTTPKVLHTHTYITLLFPPPHYCSPTSLSPTPSHLPRCPDHLTVCPFDVAAQRTHIPPLPLHHLHTHLASYPPYPHPLTTSTLT